MVWGWDFRWGASVWNGGTAPTERSYKLYADLDRDATYAYDLTDRLISMRWNVGMAEAFQEVAVPSRLTFVLDNTDKALSPDNADSDYYGLLVKGAMMMLRMWAGGSAKVMCTVRLEDVRPSAVTYGNGNERTVELIAQDPMHELLDASYAPALQEDVTVSAAIQAVFDSGVVALPNDQHYWVAGASQAGFRTRAYGDTRTRFDVANTTLDFVGDHMGAGVGMPPQSHIRDLVMTEAGGRFFWSREGYWTFHNRRHDDGATPLLTLDDTSQVLSQFIQGADLANQITIHYLPREVGSVGAVLWSSSSVPISIAAGETRKISARYRDPDNETARVGGKDFIAPASGTDYVANTQSNGSGTNVTSSLGVFVSFVAASAEITLVNNTNATMYVTTLQLRGTPIIAYNPESVTVRDAQSIYDYNRHVKVLNLPMISDAEMARNLAYMLLGRYKKPFARFERVGFRAEESGALEGYALNRTVGDCITITNGQLDHDIDYVIVGERHRVDFKQRRHETEWIVKPVAVGAYWLAGIAGASEAGETTYAGF